MRRSHRFVLLSATALMSGALGSLAADGAQTAADVDLAQKCGEIMSQEEIIQRAKSQHPGSVREIELEHKHGRCVYEVDVTDDSGVKSEMKFDAKTGELISHEVDDADEQTSDDDDN